MLRYVEVSHSYGERLALDRVSFSVERAECVALVGPSGSGKTTLFRLAYGAFAPSAGRVEIDGVDLATVHGPELRRTRARIAVIFQAHGLIDQLTVQQNVLAGTFGRRSTVDALRVMVAPRAAEYALVHDALERVGLADRVHDRAFELSGGQRQRIAIARSIAQRAELVLADEPAASLDPELAGEVITALLDDARARGATLVCVLHQPQLAQRFDRIVTLRHGRILEEEAAPAVATLP